MERHQKAIITINFLHTLALNASRPYLSLLAQSMGADPVQIGYILSLYSVIQVLIAIPMGNWIAQRGIRWGALMGSGSFLVGCLLLPFSQGLLPVGLAALLLGLGHGFTLLCGQLLTTGVQNQAMRLRCVGWISFSGSAGSFLGPLVGGFLQDLWGVNYGFWGAALFSALVLLWVPLLPGAASGKPAGAGKDMELTRGMWTDIAVSGAVFFAIDIISVYLPLYGDAQGFRAGQTGILLSIYGIAQMLVRPMLNPLCGAHTPRYVLRRCVVVIGGLMAVLGSCGSFWGLAFFVALAGAAAGLANPLTLLLVSSRGGDALRSRLLSLRLVSNYLGQSLSPIMTGWVVSLLGMSPVFWLGGAFLAGCSLFLQPQEKGRI